MNDAAGGPTVYPYSHDSSRSSVSTTSCSLASTKSISSFSLNPRHYKTHKLPPQPARAHHRHSLRAHQSLTLDTFPQTTLLHNKGIKEPSGGTSPDKFSLNVGQTTRSPQSPSNISSKACPRSAYHHHQHHHHQHHHHNHQQQQQQHGESLSTVQQYTPDSTALQKLTFPGHTRRRWNKWLKSWTNLLSAPHSSALPSSSSSPASATTTLSLSKTEIRKSSRPQHGAQADPVKQQQQQQRFGENSGENIIGLSCRSETGVVVVPSSQGRNDNSADQQQTQHPQHSVAVPTTHTPVTQTDPQATVNVYKHDSDKNEQSSCLSTMIPNSTLIQASASVDSLDTQISEHSETATPSSEVLQQQKIMNTSSASTGNTHLEVVTTTDERRAGRKRRQGSNVVLPKETLLGWFSRPSGRHNVHLVWDRIRQSHRRLGRGVITVFCLAAVVILVLC